MTKAQQALEFITDELARGRTVNASTYLKCWQVTPKIAAQWTAAGRELFKLGRDGCLYMGHGKSYNCIAYADSVLCKISSSPTIGSK